MTTIEAFVVEVTIAERRELSDVAFLREVRDDLKYSWTTGTMCSADGQRCLVGAGAFALGLNYPLLAAVYGRPDSDGEYPYITYDAANVKGRFEEDAGARLFRLLKGVPEFGMYFEELDYDLWMDNVIEFNDSYVGSIEKLLSVLEKAIELASAVAVAGADA